VKQTDEDPAMRTTTSDAGPAPVPIIDPRKGDLEDDALSPKQRSLLSIAGSLFAEISLPKLLSAWFLSIVLPGILLGASPLVASAWLTKITSGIGALAGAGAIVFLVGMAVIGWFGWRPLFRLAEYNFWTLNSVAVQPGYALCREALQHLAERLFATDQDNRRRANLRARSALGAGLLLCSLAIALAAMAWPYTRWQGFASDFMQPHRLVVPTLANAVALVSGYLAAASLGWGIADSAMDQPAAVSVFDSPTAGARTWRVAHLSDVHVVGERYGFRIECGRGGPQGNGRFVQLMDRLAAIHAENPLDIVLISGDLTDAGRSSEWAEFMDIMSRHLDLAARTLILPGNHDVNIVDRANPARLDLPLSRGKRLRQLRTLSAMDAIQGDRVRIVDPTTLVAGPAVRNALAPYRERMAAFADSGRFALSLALRRPWQDFFPMVVPPATDDGLGVVILNSNAETHFSMTNALGLMTIEQASRMAAAMRQFPRAVWIVALHHHLVEYPMAVKAFSERIGTALVNGSWFVRMLQPFARRAVVMHGHRHIDWIGAIGDLRIVSASSTVMAAKDDQPSYFLIHRLTTDGNGKLGLLEPERIDMPAGEASCGRFTNA